MRRIDSRGRQARLAPLPAIASVVPKRSSSTTDFPSRSGRANAGASTVSICAQGMLFPSTASGCLRSIIWSRRERKKSSVMAILAVGFSQISGPLFQFPRVSDVAISMFFLGLSALEGFCRGD
jgi:hypothetical protein